MKKAIAFILALTLILSFSALFGCAKDKSETVTYGGMTKEELEATKPGEYMLEKLEAGIPLSVGFAAIGDNQFTNQILGESVRAAVEKYGFTYTFLAADADTSIQLQQIENFIEMGTSIIVALPFDADLIKDVVLRAQDEGIHVVMFGVTANYDTVVATTNQAELGTQIAKMGIAWLDAEYPDAPAGSIDAAMMGQGTVVDVIQRTENMTKTAAADPRVNIVYETDNFEDDITFGFDRMEEAYTVSPDLTLTLCTSVVGAIGCNNYMVAQHPDRLADIAVFCTDYDSAIDDIMADAAEDKACLRGSILCGEHPADGTVACVEGIINGTIKAPYTLYHDLFSMVESSFDYHYDQRDEA